MGGTEVLIDMNGNGIADTAYESVNIPYWIMSNNSRKNPENRNILNDLNAMFYAYRDDELISGNESYLGAMRNLDYSAIPAELRKHWLYKEKFAGDQ